MLDDRGELCRPKSPKESSRIVPREFCGVMSRRRIVTSSDAAAVLLRNDEELELGTGLFYGKYRPAHFTDAAFSHALVFQSQQRVVHLRGIELKDDAAGRVNSRFGRQFAIGLAQLTRTVQKTQSLFIFRRCDA